MVDKQQVESVIEEQIRPSLQGHGGDIELVSVEEDATVKVKLKGACSGCPGARMTLKNGVERLLREALDETINVEAVDFE